MAESGSGSRQLWNGEDFDQLPAEVELGGQDRQHNPPATGDRPSKNRIAGGVCARGLGEGDVQGDRSRPGGGESLDQLGVHTARPRPAADLRQARLIDRHDHDIPRGRPRPGAEVDVEDHAIDAPEQVAPGDGGGAGDHEQGRADLTEMAAQPVEDHSSTTSRTTTAGMIAKGR